MSVKGTVIATLVVGADGSTSRDGSSSGLSTPADRQRFLALHRSATAIIIGRNTAIRDSYSETHVPVYVLSREYSESLGPNFRHVLVPDTSSLIHQVNEIATSHSTPIVVEAGPRLLMPLIECGVIDRLELSIVPCTPQENQIDVEALLQNFTIESDLLLDDTRLLECRYKRDASNS